MALIERQMFLWSLILIQLNCRILPESNTMLGLHWCWSYASWIVYFVYACFFNHNLLQVIYYLVWFSANVLDNLITHVICNTEPQNKHKQNKELSFNLKSQNIRTEI
jgi:hypothetical protein